MLLEKLLALPFERRPPRREHRPATACAQEEGACVRAFQLVLGSSRHHSAWHHSDRWLMVQGLGHHFDRGRGRDKSPELLVDDRHAPLHPRAAGSSCGIVGYINAPPQHVLDPAARHCESTPIPPSPSPQPAATISASSASPINDKMSGMRQRCARAVEAREREHEGGVGTVEKGPWTPPACAAPGS